MNPHKISVKQDTCKIEKYERFFFQDEKRCGWVEQHVQKRKRSASRTEHESKTNQRSSGNGINIFSTLFLQYGVYNLRKDDKKISYINLFFRKTSKFVLEKNNSSFIRVQLFFCRWDS